MTDMTKAPPPPNRRPWLARYHWEQDTCRGDVSVVTTGWAREMFVRCDPGPAARGQVPAVVQAERLYGCLDQLLKQIGSRLADVVLERVFFRNLAGDRDAFADRRQRAYRAADVTDERLPLGSFLTQPPCRGGQLFELQAYAIQAGPPTSADVQVEDVPADARCPAAKIVHLGPCRYLHVRGIDGRDDDGHLPATFRAQSDTMFSTAASLLRRHGASFRHVVRTWCYLRDIDRDYDAFNESRNAFFRDQDLERLPASTGINAGLRTPHTHCSLDFDALLTPDVARVEVMHAATLNEATEYDVAFSRGIKLALPDKTLLVLSGTASVDQSGATIHVGNIEKQLDRMLVNVEQLLAPHGATLADLGQVITYLKSADDLPVFLDLWRQRLPEQIPHSVVQAHVCRADLLCELEGCAILPAQR